MNTAPVTLTLYSTFLEKKGNIQRWKYVLDYLTLDDLNKKTL